MKLWCLKRFNDFNFGKEKITVRKIESQKLEFLISKHTNQELHENKIGCKEVIVHQEGECVYSGVFGTSSVGGLVAKKGLIYRAASMTKPITTTAVLQLVDKGLIDLDDKISKFYPKAKDLKVAIIKNEKIVSSVPLENEITVRNLLSHTSGIGSDPITIIFPNTNNTMTLDQAIEDIFTKPILFEPNSSERYSATEAFDIAAGIVQKVSGIPFDKYLKENIFEPLGMENTTFCPTDEQWEKVVAMHNRTENGESENSIRPTGCVFDGFLTKRMPAGAGLVTTADDYIKFADMLCFGGKSKDGKQILSENAVNLMSTPQCDKSLGYEKWGLGVRVVTSEDYPHGLDIGCFGWSGAYGTHFWVDRKNRISVVMMKNSCYDGGAGNKSACQLERDVSESLI